MKRLLFTVLLIAQWPIQAQMSKTLLDTAETELKARYAVALNGSSVGVGLEVARSISEKLNIRLRANSFKFNNINTAVDIGNTGSLDITGNAHVVESDISLEYLPFKKFSFKLVGGLGYFFNANGSIDAIYAERINFGQIEITPEQLGTADLQLDYSGIAPYLGLGFGRAIPKNRVGVSFEMGTFYLTEPNLLIDATNMLAPFAEQAAQLEQNIADYRWYPFLNLKIAVKI